MIQYLKIHWKNLVQVKHIKIEPSSTSHAHTKYSLETREKERKKYHVWNMENETINKHR